MEPLHPACLLPPGKILMDDDLAPGALLVPGWHGLVNVL
jgi:hypothetical protein